MSALQPEQIDIQKVRQSRLILQRVFSELKWAAKTKDSLNRSRRRNLHLLTINFHDVAAGWQVSESFRHARERIIGVKKTARGWIHKSDSAGHVCQHFFVKNNFALEAFL